MLPPKKTRTFWKSQFRLSREREEMWGHIFDIFFYGGAIAFIVGTIGKIILSVLFR